MKNPERNTIHDTFDGSVRYAAPVYQRYYVWGYDELSALLDDIENAADENSTQFIGATVVQDFGKKGGNQSPNEYLIIDGQQRLTTIYLLICGLVRSYLLGKKEEAAMTIAQTYLCFTAGRYAGMPKLLPTLQDRKQLYDILTTDIHCIDWKFNGDEADQNSHRKDLKLQWVAITKYFDESFRNTKGVLIKKKIEKFQENLLNHVEYIQITLDLSDDANTAFSKLNFRGVPLSISDLVRNDVFSRIRSNKKEQLDKFYTDIWSPFEKKFPARSFDQYVTIYSTIKFKGAITKARAFPELQKSWAKKNPSAIVAELATYADLYIALISFVPLPGMAKDMNEHIQRISLMPKSTVTWPYLLQVINALREKTIAKKQAIDCLKTVESFLVRRAIVGLEPTGLHVIFKSLWNKAGADNRKLIEKIETSTIRFPTDTMIKEALATENMYSKQITKYMLVQREVRMNKKHGYDNAIENFSVEHVMPKSRAGNWAKLFSIEEHAALLNTIGNLVPLTKEQNSRIKDVDWATKKKVLQGSNWKLAQSISRVRAWDRAQITKKTREFTVWALKEWPAKNE